ncbi:MAG: glycosyltransferase family 4 protein [Planctomycetota bacterium]
MRILHVMESTIGGTRRHIVDAAAGLRSRGLDVHLAVSTLRQPDFERDLQYLEASGVGVLRLPMVREIQPGRDLAHLAALARHLECLRPDVVHTHSSKAGALGRLASVATGIGARVHTPHTFAFLFDAMFPAWKRELFRDVEMALAGHTQRTIAVSETEAETIRRSGVVPADRIRVVANGLDPSPWVGARPIPRAEIGVPEGVPLAAVIGLLNLAKGQDLAIEARVRPGLDRLHLVVAGDGEMRAQLESLAARLGVTGRVRFLGHRSDAPAIVSACDFTLLPSRWEGMPYIVLESMAAGRPVVATPVDGARDVVRPGENGFLASAIGVDPIAAACRQILGLTPAECRAMGERGRGRVLASWTSARMVDGLLAVYGELE